MDGERFDSIIRHALGDASRRGVLRSAIGALATAGLTALGPGIAPDAAAETQRRETATAETPTTEKEEPPEASTGAAATGRTATATATTDLPRRKRTVFPGAVL